jgi:hypothetical protein
MALREKIKNRPIASAFMRKGGLFGEFFGQNQQSETITITVYAGPNLTLAVDKVAGYIGDSFNFEGFYRDGQGNSLPGYEVSLVVNGSVVASAMSGADGSYSMQWTPTVQDTYSIYAEAPRPGAQV